MHLSKTVAALSFFGALAVGIAFAYIADGREEALAVDAPRAVSPVVAAKAAPVRAESLLGVWRGTWGYGRERCTIEIARVDGDKFYGTLRKEGAEIALAGALDRDGRMVFFRETRVLKLGAGMSEWSLGKNSGSISPDGRTLTGTGTDRWGMYGWDASKD